MRWENNNPLKMNENITLFFRDIIFADLRILYTFHFEVKLYKYVVLRTERVLRGILLGVLSDCEGLVGVME